MFCGMGWSAPAGPSLEQHTHRSDSGPGERTPTDSASSVLFNNPGIFKKGPNAFTFQGIPGESELVNNVSGNVGLDALAHLGLTFCSFQALKKLLWIKFLERTKHTRVSIWQKKRPDILSEKATVL